MSEGTQIHPTDIYEISDRELHVLEEGVTDSLYITLATIALAAAFINAVVVAVFTFGSGAFLVALAVIMLGAMIGAALLLALGIQQRRTKRRMVKSLVQEIKSRKRPV